MALTFDQKSGWQDWANVVLAILLFISPWVFQFAEAPAASETGGAVGSSAAAWNVAALPLAPPPQLAKRNGSGSPLPK